MPLFACVYFEHEGQAPSWHTQLVSAASHLVRRPSKGTIAHGFGPCFLRSALGRSAHSLDHLPQSRRMGAAIASSGSSMHSSPTRLASARTALFGAGDGC